MAEFSGVPAYPPYNEAIDEEINPQCGDCIELASRADALLAFEPFRGDDAAV
ncbi:hypothetical protein OHB94_005482 [Klebsiella pneumoniae]|nr:hypothetical protein [Klebsiella pneumoniae]EKV9798265.1 hypothetical protein [Klebsiella pneumoniae]